MSDLDAKRDEIAAAIAAAIGLGDGSTRAPEDRAEIDRLTRAAIDDDATGVPAEAGSRLRRLVTEYRDLAALRADSANVRLAEEGEVFAPEDDA